MKLESLADQAYTAYTLGSGELSATDAVKSSISGASLNPEEIHRVCTMVNRKIHGMEKKSHGSGSLWKSRWTTAKAGDITGNTDSPYAKWGSTTERVATARNKKSQEKQSEKRSSKISLSELTPSYLEEGGVDDVDIEEMFDIPEEGPQPEGGSLGELQATAFQAVQDQEDAVALGESELMKAEMSVDVSSGALAEAIQEATTSLGLSLGEVLLVGETANVPMAHLASATEGYLQDNLVSPEALEGTLRDPNGDLMVGDIEDAQLHLDVRDGIREFLAEGLTPEAEEDPHIAKILAAVADFEDALEGKSAAEEAVAALKSDLSYLRERMEESDVTAI